MWFLLLGRDDAATTNDVVVLNAGRILFVSVIFHSSSFRFETHQSYFLPCFDRYVEVVVMIIVMMMILDHNIKQWSENGHRMDENETTIKNVCNYICCHHFCVRRVCWSNNLFDGFVLNWHRKTTEKVESSVKLREALAKANCKYIRKPQRWRRRWFSKLTHVIISSITYNLD